MFVYSAGFRVGEVVKLKSEDIDSERILIYISGSKSRNAKYTLLFQKTLKNSRQYREKYITTKWLSGGIKEGKYVSTGSVDEIFRNACDLLHLITKPLFEKKN